MQKHEELRGLEILYNFREPCASLACVILIPFCLIEFCHFVNMGFYWYCLWHRYAPIIPMVLVNGSEGIGTGWSSFVPNYNPRDIIANIKHMLNDEPLQPMVPWYKGFKVIFLSIFLFRYLLVILQNLI